MVFAAASAIFILQIVHFNRLNTLNNKYNARLILFLLLLACSINVVYRDLMYTDTPVYINYFTEIGYLDFSQAAGNFSSEPLFVLISWLLAKVTEEPRVFLGVMWLLFVVPFYVYLKRIFTSWQLVVVLFTYLNFPFLYSYTTNGIRQGLSMIFIVLASTYFIKDERSKRMYVFMIISSLFHWSGLFFSIALFLLMKLNINLRMLVMIWGVGALLFITNTNKIIESFAMKFIPKLSQYTDSITLSHYSLDRNRIDFLLFSLLWIVASLFLYYFVHRDESYKKIIRIYLMFNIVFVLFGFVAYSDRVAGYSWFIIPLLVWYPIYNSKKYNSYLAYVAFALTITVGIVMGLYENYNLFSFIK